jgi:hypothetical protein
VKRALNSLQEPFPVAVLRELGWRAEALSFWQLLRGSGRSIPISDGLGLKGAPLCIQPLLAIKHEQSNGEMREADRWLKSQSPKSLS